MKVIVCDLDGSLMPPSSGLYVSEAVKNKLIEIQKKGILVILNSARVFQGIYPLSQQIQMEQFGGYIIDNNGAHAYDTKTKETIVSHPLNKADVLDIWKMIQEFGLDAGFSQPDCFIASGMSDGFLLDEKNCQVRYVITENPQIQADVHKCSASSTVEKVGAVYSVLKEKLEALYPVKVMHNAPSMIDIIHVDSNKAKTVEDVLKRIGCSWQSVSAIGDGNSDVPVLEKAFEPITLENGCKAAKDIATFICPSCYEDGCLVWLEKLYENN